MIIVKCQSECGKKSGDAIHVDVCKIQSFPTLAIEMASVGDNTILIDAEQAVTLGEALVKWGKKNGVKPAEKKITGTL